MIEAVTTIIVAAIAAWFGARWVRKDERARVDNKRLADEAAAKQRMRDAENDIPSDPAVLRDWLRARDPGSK